MINIRRAVLDDIPLIMRFLDEHWLKGYVLAHDREFFDWQFMRDGKLNIWIGIDEEEGKLYAMQGGLYYCRENHPGMSQSPDASPDVAGLLWISLKSPNPLLAFETGDAMWAALHPRASFSPGLREKAVRIYRLNGYTVRWMDHYYRLAERAEYRLVHVTEKRIPYILDNAYSLESFSDIEEMKSVISEDQLFKCVPCKDYAYINWRYFQHPIFHYDFWKIKPPMGPAEAVLITREERARGAKSCKIVDFYGDSRALGKIAPALDRMMDERGYEFTDVYSYGVPVSIYEEGGFVRCNPDGPDIIPNSFQPFEMTNSSIALVDPGVPGIRLFRGDGDQDKPRLPSAWLDNQT